MERIELGTPDLTQENIQKLGELFPQVLTEIQDESGQVQRAVDFDALRDLLGDVAEGTRERYQFTWPGKREAKAEARRPIEKTMRPCPEESVNWDTTENLYIEGDNLDALKILKETYAGKVKMIYIDPPYNTGHDFVYDDDFAVANAEHLEESGQLDERGKLVTNLESNGRFHSDWCSMMYPRLMLARDLLSADGVMFVSIDDNEAENLKKCSGEIFGEENFIFQIAWRRTDNQPNIGKIARVKEYVLAFAKDVRALSFGKLPLTERAKGEYRYKDEKGFFRRAILLDKTRGRHRYLVKTKSGNMLDGPWMKTEDEFRRLDAEGAIYWTSGGDEQPYGKIYLKDSKGAIPNDFWGIEYGTNQRASLEVEKLFDKRLFDFPKPVSLIQTLVTLGAEGGSDIVLDFFSGSATTAHAIMRLNAEDAGNRKCILVQFPEETDPKSEAAKAGYANICEIGKERIRRAGAKIKAEVEEANRQLKLDEEPKKVPDIGFRVLKIDSSNFADVMTTPDATSQQMLLDFSDNLKDGRSDMDILFEVLPKFQIPYSAKIEEITICGKRCFNVSDGLLIACFDKDVDTDTIEAIAKMQPLYAVMRDASMANDATHANFEELFKTYSPDTIRRVI